MIQTGTQGTSALFPRTEFSLYMRDLNSNFIKLLTIQQHCLENICKKGRFQALFLKVYCLNSDCQVNCTFKQDIEMLMVVNNKAYRMTSDPLTRPQKSTKQI